MDLRCPVKPWTKVIGLALLVISVGCSQAVLLTHETEQGGVVTYLFKEGRGGPMGSPHRRDAVKLIEGKCPSGHTVSQRRGSAGLQQHVQRGRRGRGSQWAALGDSVSMQVGGRES
jgi:hypothetical protein